MLKALALAVSLMFLSGCIDDYPEIADRYEVMKHPFYEEVVYHYRFDQTRCIVSTKFGKKVTVRCVDLSK